MTTRTPDRMSRASLLALETAASAKALKRNGGALYRPFPRALSGVSIGFEPALMMRLVDDGLMAWVNDLRSAAVLTEAGRERLGRVG